MNELERSLAYIPNQNDLSLVKSLPSESLPKISAVVPSFNQAKFLSQTLDSILSQNYPRLEIFIADGGSTDGSVDILASYARKYPDYLRFVSEPDGGQYHAVNKGIEATKGEIIAWINSDDVYLPEAFWKVVAFFFFNRCALVVYGRNHYTDEQLTPILEYPVDWSPILREQKRRMMHFCLPPQPSLFFRRIAVTLLGKLASPILDYELWLRWQQDTQFYFIDDYLSLSRLHTEAQTIKNHSKLIQGICGTVHQYYLMVPYSWTIKRAYDEAYGNIAWTTAETPPVTHSIRLKAIGYWLYYNARWSPRTLARCLKAGVRAIKESLYGRV